MLLGTEVLCPRRMRSAPAGRAHFPPPRLPAATMLCGVGVGCFWRVMSSCPPHR